MAYYKDDEGWSAATTPGAGPLKRPPGPYRGSSAPMWLHVLGGVLLVALIFFLAIAVGWN